LNTQAGSAELGYWLFPEYWGQGLAKAICATFIPLVCRQFGLRQLTAIIEPENIASERLLLGLGFEFERLEKQAEQKNGRWIDLLHYKKIIPGSL
jgi:ribosomal-protein-alanine N-acetyltransferase